MLTKPELETRLHDALRSGDDVAKRTLRMILTAWKLAEVERGGSLDEAAASALLQKEAKTRRETIADAERAGRPDLARAAEAELAYLEAFLPRALSEQELVDLARDAIQQVGATRPDQLGQVMKVLMPAVTGRADGKSVSETVRNLLTAS